MMNTPTADEGWDRYYRVRRHTRPTCRRVRASTEALSPSPSVSRALLIMSAPELASVGVRGPADLKSIKEMKGCRVSCLIRHVY